jgi:leucyl aminopeptidase (aminopeptidase T)
MKIARDCAGVSTEDIVAIVCDYASFEVANQVTKACLAIGACTNMIIFEPTKSHGTPPPDVVGAAIEKATVAFLITTKSMSHTSAVKAARALGCRIITMPEVYPHMLVYGAIEADFPARSIVACKVKDILTNAKTARIICEENGTDISFSLEGRTGRAVDGIATTPGSFAAPPNIEACIAPVEECTNGVFVINASIAGVGIVTEPVKLTVRNGVIELIEGGNDADLLESIFTMHDNPNCFRISELGIGLNPNAIPCGTLLEDEAPLGTVHIAAGNNASNFPGGQVSAPLHIDMIAKDATLYIDDIMLLKDGVFQDEALD